MAVKLDTLRPPNKWGSKTDEYQSSPRLYLKNSINLKFSISGGWECSEEDCVIIKKFDDSVDQNKPFDGTAVEDLFVEKRIYAALIVYIKSGDGF